MAYNLFLFDLDDTLLDFKASEQIAFASTLQQIGVFDNVPTIFNTYRNESTALWKLLEEGKTTKDFLKVERFRRTFERHNIDGDSEKASSHYLELLSENVVHVDHAVDICQFLSTRGEIGIITNGIEKVQKARIKKSALAPYISFMAVSEECGFAKPDVRFFEHSSKLARKFSKKSSLMIGDRIDTDIQGAHNFGIDSCLFNPNKEKFAADIVPKYEIAHLSELRKITNYLDSL